MGFLAPLAIGAGLGLAGSALSSGGRGNVPTPPSYEPMTEKPPALKPMPPLEDIYEFIDQISGVQFVPVKLPGGKTQMKLTRVPLTADEDKIYQNGRKLLQAALKNVESVYQYDPNAIKDFKPFIDAFANINNERKTQLSKIGDFQTIERDIENYRQMQLDLVDQEFGMQRRLGQDELNHRGLGGSTANQEYQAALAGEQARTRRLVDMEARLFGEEMKGRQLDRESGLYDLNELDRQARLQQAELGYQLPIQHQGAIAGLQQAGLEQGLAQQGVGMNITNQDIGRMQGTLAPQMSLEGSSQRNYQTLQQHQAGVTNEQNRYMLEMNRHAANTNQRMNQYQAQLAAFNMKPPSFGNLLGNNLSGLGGFFFKRGLNRIGW